MKILNLANPPSWIGVENGDLDDRIILEEDPFP